MNRFLTKACLALTLLATGVASAEDLTITSLTKGSFAGQTPEGQHVVESDQQFRDLRLGQLTSAPIDFTTHMVIAIVLPPQTNAGHSVTIDRITSEELPTTQPLINPLIPPVVVHPTLYRNSVFFTEAHAAGSLTGSAVSTPYHVVKIPRREGLTEFLPSPPIGSQAGPLPFTEALSASNVGFTAAQNVVIRDRDDLNRFLAPWTAAASPLIDVNFSTHSLIAVALGQMPASSTVKVTGVRRDLNGVGLPMPGFQPQPRVTVTYNRRVNPGFTAASSFPLTVIRIPKLAAIDQVQFIESLPLPPPTPNASVFDAVKMTRVQDGVTGPWTTNVSIDSDRVVRVSRAHPTAKFAQIPPGRLTDDELTELQAAVIGARMNELDPVLLVPIPFSVAVTDRFELSVSSVQHANDGATSGNTDHLGQFETQLRPLIEVLTEIGDRVIQEASASTVKGVVHMSGGRVTIRANSHRYRVTDTGRDEAYSILRSLEGHTVEVLGTIVRQLPGESRLHIVRMISPEQVQDDPIVFFENDEARVHFRGNGQQIALEGRFKRLLRDADGARVTYRGAAYRDAAGEIVRLIAHRLQATAVRDVTLRQNWQPVTQLSDGDQVWIQRLTWSGYFRVESPAGSGYGSRSAFRIGQPVPLHGGAGLSGALGGK